MSYLSCSNYAQSAIIWHNWVLFRPITIQTSLVGCLYHICLIFRRHITTTLWALYTVTPKWLSVFFIHACVPFSCTVCTMCHTWPYIFQLLTSSPTRFLWLDVKRKTPPLSPSDSVFLPTVFSIPDHLQPCWSRILYDHADSTADYVSFTPAKCRSLATSNPTDEPTQFSVNDFYVNNTEYTQDNFISVTTDEQFFSDTHFLLEDHLICLTPMDHTAQVMILYQSLLHVMHGRQSRSKNREYASSVHTSLSSLPQGDHLRITGAYMFRIFVISQSVPSLFCFRFRIFSSLATSFCCLFMLFAFILYCLLASGGLIVLKFKLFPIYLILRL
jgi:hypothetical protein